MSIWVAVGFCPISSIAKAMLAKGLKGGTKFWMAPYGDYREGKVPSVEWSKLLCGSPKTFSKIICFDLCLCVCLMVAGFLHLFLSGLFFPCSEASAWSSILLLYNCMDWSQLFGGAICLASYKDGQKHKNILLLCFYIIFLLRFEGDHFKLGTDLTFEGFSIWLLLYLTDMSNTA